ncbi:MAG TPA: hypothetical protein VNJ01_00055 [Bacteriovoracaceae bacterium]|nr:hypothetical protein [Bacteriovoracaceae bacterium]
MKNLVTISVLTTSLLVLTACNFGGSGSSGTSGRSAFKSTSITASEFVTALNTIFVDPEHSYLELDIDQTIRSSNTDETNGDHNGRLYEVVDYNGISGIFTGRNSGYQYEAQSESTDVSLLTAEKEQVEFFKKAARVSHAFNLGIETSLSLVTLAEKTETLLGKSRGELTSTDQAAFAADLIKLTGVSLIEVMKASSNEKDKKALISKIADKIGTSTANLEGKILPALFNSQL